MSCQEHVGDGFEQSSRRIGRFRTGVHSQIAAPARGPERGRLPQSARRPRREHTLSSPSEDRRTSVSRRPHLPQAARNERRVFFGLVGAAPRCRTTGTESHVRRISQRLYPIPERGERSVDGAFGASSTDRARTGEVSSARFAGPRTAPDRTPRPASRGGPPQLLQPQGEPGAVEPLLSQQLEDRLRETAILAVGRTNP